MSEKQLCLFEKPISEFDTVWEAINRMKLSNDKVRKRLFVEIKDLESQIIKVQAENDRMKFQIENKSVVRWTA